MKLKTALILILSSSLLLLTPSFVRSEEEIILTTGTMQEKRDAFRVTLEAEREARREKIGEIREIFKDQRAAYKEKLKAIKDVKKKKLTEKIDNRMATVNKNQTARMIKALEKLSEHITKIEERVTKAKTAGVDTSAVEALIETAKTSISTALAAVEEQAAKDYVFEISDETNLGQSIKASYDELSQDLKTVQQLLKDAKDAVVAVYKEAAGLLEKITPSPSPVITP